MYKEFLSWLDLETLSVVVCLCKGFRDCVHLWSVIHEKEDEGEIGNLLQSVYNRYKDLKTRISQRKRLVYLLERVEGEEKKDVSLADLGEKAQWITLQRGIVPLSDRESVNFYYCFKTIFISSKKDVVFNIDGNSITCIKSGCFEMDLFSVFVCPGTDMRNHTIQFLSDDPDCVIKIKTFSCIQLIALVKRPKFIRVDRRIILSVSMGMSFKFIEAGFTVPCREVIDNYLSDE